MVVYRVLFIQIEYRYFDEETAEWIKENPINCWKYPSGRSLAEKYQWQMEVGKFSELRIAMFLFNFCLQIWLFFKVAFVICCVIGVVSHSRFDRIQFWPFQWSFHFLVIYKKHWFGITKRTCLPLLCCSSDIFCGKKPTFSLKTSSFRRSSKATINKAIPFSIFEESEL